MPTHIVSLDAQKEIEASELHGNLAKVGIVTFNSRYVHFYTVRVDAADPVRVYVSDVDDPVGALPPSRWLLPIATHRTHIGKCGVSTELVLS